MRKTIFSLEHEQFLSVLLAAREKAGITQVELARKLKVHQSFVSKIESGERRVDIVELENICKALGISLLNFVQDYERAKTSSASRKR